MGNSREHVERRAIFKQNYDKMVAHNKKYDAGEETWFMRINEDADLTTEEWMEKRLSSFPAHNATKMVDVKDPRIEARLEEIKKQEPRDYFNWVDYGYVSSVKNQAGCGSCAAFSTMGAIESCSAIYGGGLANDLSEQHILDCAYNHQYNDGSPRLELTCRRNLPTPTLQEVPIRSQPATRIP